MYLTESVVRDYINEADLILKDCNPNYTTPEHITIELTNARSFWAKVIKARGSNACRIRVSRVFSEITDPEKFNIRLKSTMAHELLHTIPGCMNHGPKWKAEAARVNRYYPELKISRTCSMSEFGIDSQERKDKYIVKCAKCGREWKYQRKPQIWEWVGRNISPYTCPCGGCKFEGVQLR